MVAGPHRNAFQIEHCSDIVRVYAFHDERNHSGLVPRGSDDSQAGDLLQSLGCVEQQLVFVGADLFDSEIAYAMRSKLFRWRPLRHLNKILRAQPFIESVADV